MDLTDIVFIDKIQRFVKLITSQGSTMPSDSYRDVDATLENIGSEPARETSGFWRKIVNRFRDMDPFERELLYDKIEDYASMLTFGHSTIVTEALRHLRDLYKDITGG